MLGTDERRLRRRNANKRSAQKMRDLRQAELEHLRQQMEHANQATGLMLHQIAEMEKHIALLGEASQHYHKLCQTAQAEGHQLSAEVAKLSSMITPKTAFTHPTSVQSKDICQPQSARCSAFVFSSQQLYLPSSTPILKPAAPATAWSQNSSALSPRASHTSTVFAQQNSALFSESGISSSELHCQHTSALLSEPGPSNEMSHQHCSALDEGPAQPTANQCQNSSVSHWELQHCAAPFCQHCPTPFEPLQDCSVLSDAFFEDLSMLDLPAIEDLTAGSALSFSGGGW